MLKKLRRKSFISSLITLYLVFYSDWGKMYFFTEIKKFANFKIYISYAILIPFVSYFLISLLSDIWSRKKVLLISAFFMLMSTFFINFNFPLLGTLFFVLSPLTSVSQAGYCDTHLKESRDPNIVNTFFFQPLPWLILYKLSDQLSFFKITLLLGVIGFLIAFLFSDPHDKELRFPNENSDNSSNKFGVKEVVEKHGWLICILIPLSFWFVNSGWSLAFLNLEEHVKAQTALKYSSFSFGTMFLLGVFIARLIISSSGFIEIKVKDNINGGINDKLYIVLIVTLIAIIFLMMADSYLYEFFFSLNSSRETITKSLSSMTAIGGILIPVIYALFGSRLGYHSLGVVYVLLELTQSSSEIFGVKVMEYFPAVKNPFFLTSSVVSLSFVSFLLSLFLLRHRDNKIRGSL
ncbi:MAG: hypothetical protein AAF443_01025 [Chlamydiota bacterium]